VYNNNKIECVYNNNNNNNKIECVYNNNNNKIECVHNNNNNNLFSRSRPSQTPNWCMRPPCLCRKSRNYQQSSWSVFDQAKTLSFSAVIKCLSAVL
jgi:hypothetical protein